MCNGQCLCIACNVVYRCRVGFISTVKEVGFLAFRSFLIFSDGQSTPLWKSLLWLSICFGSQPQEFLSLVHSNRVSLASEKHLFYEGLRNVFPVTHYWYERLGWSVFMLQNKWRTWLYLWKSHGLVALLRCSLWFCTCVLEVICLTPGTCVFKPERKRADLSSLSSMSTDTSTGRQLLNCFSILWAVILLYFHVPVNFSQKRLISHLRTNQTLIIHVKWS